MKSITKISRKMVSIGLMLALVLTGTLSAFAGDESNVDSIGQTEIEFSPADNVHMSELPQDTVVAIVEGVPIYAKDILVSGDISDEKKDAITQAYQNGAKDDNGTFDRAFADDCMMVLPSQHQDTMILIEGTTTSTGFSQTEKHSYIPKARITKYAEKLESGLVSDFVNFLLGFIPKIGPGISIGSFLVGAVTKADIKRLRSLRDDGKAAQYSVYKSRYGTTTFTGQWDKKTVKGKSIPGNPAKYVVTARYYQE